ncbi:ImmA/IrrE family metallo-endopeptidase [Paraburkholderia tropica]|uniref:ImmA/IrrE family metallo-endopeptidase n=1 Tax=Paraburkholderia tropica TaxID=92647 RepID=UPI002AAFFE52|nr:ImmA/IrrE family metallo-endopeptidase [Paraburkholderia tropica]
MINAKRRAEIEKIVRGMHHEIVQSAKLKYSCGLPPYPQLFSPDIAIEKYGYTYEIRETMPGALSGGQFRTAGMIDTEQCVVMVASDMKFETQRFTAAHELAHLVLHESLPGMRQHRDRPVTGEHLGHRDPIEEEADYFAAIWLAPGPTVEHYFKKRFTNAPLVLNELTAFHVAGYKGVADLMASKPGSLVFAIAVARATKFSGRTFDSLASFFGLSPTAMGIRLRELGLVSY